MSALADKIRKAREKAVEVGGFSFTIRRPTDVEMVEFAGTKKAESLLKFVVGWDRVKEIDLIPGGDPVPAKFDAEACQEWLTDRSDLFPEVINAIIESYQAHKVAVGDAEKK